MALVLKDRVRETSTTTGTGTLTLAGAVAGFQSFSSVGTGNTTYYTIATSSDWEVGIGTWTSPDQLSRDTILASTNGGAAVNFGAGTKDVFVTYPAEKSVNINANDGDATINGMTVGLGGGQDFTNVAIGSGALANYQPLWVNHGYSIAIGAGALSNANISGNNQSSGNVAIGVNALATNDDGYENVAIGVNTLPLSTGSENTAIGANAMFSTTTGESNVGIGSYALYNNYTGSNNMAIGVNALTNNLTGDNNTAIGANALNSNYAGLKNTAIGSSAMYYLGYSADGNNNIAIGADTLVNVGANYGGNQNVAIGVNALNALDVYATGGGNNNVAIGYSSGSAIDNASNNVIIGSYTGATAPMSGSGNNYIILSDGAGNVRQTINGSGALSFNAGTNYGTSGQLFQSNGSGAAPSWGRTITSGTAAPSGGSDGDIYLQYV